MTLKLKRVISKKWQKLVSEFYSLESLCETINRLDDLEKQGEVVYPKKEDRFRIFEMLEPSEVRVVILGQDPYHQKSQAQGYSFSVPEGVKIPPSLKNIFKELSSDLDCPVSNSGNLKAWVEQGVFLLNSFLTVEDSKPGSHQKLGWSEFTDAVLKGLSERDEPIVFILWGAFAISKESYIDTKKHTVLKSAHPSPLSAYRGFFGSKVFSKTNQSLLERDRKPIDWALPNSTMLEQLPLV